MSVKALEKHQLIAAFVPGASLIANGSLGSFTKDLTAWIVTAPAEAIAVVPIGFPDLEPATTTTGGGPLGPGYISKPPLSRCAVLRYFPLKPPGVPMLPSRARILLVLLTLAAPLAQAQIAIREPLEAFVYPVLPHPGVYYDPTQSGTGLTVDRVAVGADTFVFATYYHYDAAGAPTWMNLAAAVHQATMAEYSANGGLAAWVQSEWVRASGGQCFDCAYTVNSVTTPPYGPRTLELIGGRHLRLPASGNAANRDMRLAKALPASGSPSQRLLEKGAVWAVKRRFGALAIAGDGGGEPAAWVYLRKRPTTEKVHFLDNAYGNAEPAFLRMADRNSPDQYEFVKAVEWDALPTQALIDLYGKGHPNIDDRSDNPLRDAYTVVIDPAADHIRMIGRCAPTNGGATPACPYGASRTQATVTEMADVIDAGPNELGQERLVIRSWFLAKATGEAYWSDEYELTRVPDAYARAIVPTLPASIATGAQ